MRARVLANMWVVPVKEQPLLSLIGVAAIGYAIGFLIHSPMSPLMPKPKTKRYFG